MLLTMVRHKVGSTVSSPKPVKDRFMDPLKPVIDSIITIDGLAKPLNSPNIKRHLETINPLQNMINREISHNVEINKNNEFISTTENTKIDKKHKNNKKIQKDSVGITKANEKNLKSEKEKIIKDSIGITKTHEKNTKYKKCLKKSKIKKKSMLKISRNVIQKKLNNKKISKKANVKNKNNAMNIMFSKNQICHKIDTNIRKPLKTNRDKVVKSITSKSINNIGNTVLTVEGVLEDIMSKNGPHLWEKQLLEIVNQYDDKNNRARICAYRKTIVMLQDRLHKRDDPHMIRVIIKKILKSYKKRLEVALDTLTITPPSSDDEDAENETVNCFNFISNRPPAVYEVLKNFDETYSVDTTKNTQTNEKEDQNTFVEGKVSYNNIKNRKIIIKNRRKTKRIKKNINKKLNRSTPKKAKAKQPLKQKISKKKSDMPSRKVSKSTNIQQQKQFDQNNSLIKKREKEVLITHLDISNIDCIVQSWRYPMCVACAVKCNATYLHDLYLASINCQNKCHLIFNRTSILKG